ncbi:hypothetical protein HII31_08641 [Pseudocercospora fuligena]|uniref:Cyclase n=1 Tax=Pseudocercospora fuligena TaxID=685502 RepID=A0A8H6VKR4_9PEZI|nr:hypothetical protein HII31_08641 [Pseudocercospora fuligena]
MRFSPTDILVGRGVLLDIWSFLNKSYDPFTSHAITFKEIEECAKAQNVRFQYGDILIIRTGWVDAYLRKSKEERDKLGDVVGLNHEFVGVEQSQDMVNFLHDTYFSAVAGDQPGFEKWPPLPNLVLHSILLPLWGLPIGEMWDLEELSKVCREKGQYTFFFASTPANVPGGVGSISNAMAVF